MIEAKVLKNSIPSARRTRTVREVNENQTLQEWGLLQSLTG